MLTESFQKFTAHPAGLGQPGAQNEVLSTAQSTNEELDKTCLSIVDLIDSINTVNSKDVDRDTPIHKITQLLSAHETALLDIERQSEKLKKDISKLKHQGGAMRL